MMTYEEGLMDSSMEGWIFIPLTMGKLPFREKPHEELANLHNDAVKTYGASVKWQPILLHAGRYEGVAATIEDDILKCQEWLRRAWRGDAEALEFVEDSFSWGGLTREVGSFGVELSSSGTLRVRFRRWEIICILFFRDLAADKIAICANPNCHSPYLVKRRRTQKLCGAPKCKAWLQSKHSLKWWHRTGKKRYAKKHKALRRRKP